MVASTISASFLLFLVTLLSAPQWFVAAQGFLRDGFSNSAGNEMKGEMKLDEDQQVAGMTREMFLMQDMEWELQPPALDEADDLDGRVKSHVQKYMKAPITLKLNKRKGRFGLRAVGQMKNGKKLRAFWRQGAISSSAPSQRLKASDFLTSSYDEAVRSRLFMVEFELQLPPVSKRSKVLPSVVYQVAIEPGSMNTKAMVPRGAGKVRIYPQGRGDAAAADAPAPTCVDAGTCHVGVVSMRAGIVDPGWAKGRSILRKGRPTGVV